MALMLTDSANYSAIADSIRAKGVEGNWKPSEMASAIDSISGDGGFFIPAKLKLIPEKTSSWYNFYKTATSINPAVTLTYTFDGGSETTYYFVYVRSNISSSFTTTYTVTADGKTISPTTIKSSYTFAYTIPANTQTLVIKITLASNSASGSQYYVNNFMTAQSSIPQTPDQEILWVQPDNVSIDIDTSGLTAYGVFTENKIINVCERYELITPGGIGDISDFKGVMLQ